jgi:antitoxin component of MazEF toxin-antitoxin module
MKGLAVKFYARTMLAMTIERHITKVGNSLGILIPRDIVEAMGVESGTPVRLSLVGRQLVIEPTDAMMSEQVFQRAFAAVLRREAPVFQGLADYDAGRTAKEPTRARRR